MKRVAISAVVFSTLLGIRVAGAAGTGASALILQDKHYRIWAGEMAQRLRALTAPSRGPGFKSQQLHGGSQPSVMGI